MFVQNNKWTIQKKKKTEINKEINKWPVLSKFTGTLAIEKGITMKYTPRSLSISINRDRNRRQSRALGIHKLSSRPHLSTYEMTEISLTVTIK
jgi:hypothetical protein